MQHNREIYCSITILRRRSKFSMLPIVNHSSCDNLIDADGTKTVTTTIPASLTLNSGLTTTSIPVFADENLCLRTKSTCRTANHRASRCADNGQHASDESTYSRTRRGACQNARSVSRQLGALRT